VSAHTGCLAILVLCGLLPPPAAASAAAPREDSAGPALSETVPVDGDPFRAGLAAIDPPWQLTFQGRDSRRVVPAAGIVSWGQWPEVGQKPLVILADGGLLVADVSAIARGNLICRSALFGEIALPLDRVAGAIFSPPADRPGRDLAIDRIASASGQSDRVLLTNEDELKGSVQALQDGKIQLRAAVGTRPIDVHRVAAVVLNPVLMRRDYGSAKQLRAWAGLSDGSRLLAGRLVLDEKSLAITTVGGFTWKTSPKELAALQPLGGQVAYLSDWKAAAYKHTPYLTLRWPYHGDRSVSGAWLRSAGRLYLKGLGVHSTARLTYTLTEPYRRFQAQAAIDDETGGRGSVVFRVLVDDQVRYSSPIVRGGSPPLPISVDAAGAKKLELVVEFADRADELDHADWLDARLVR
jgi:hypothetical protein